MIELTQLACVWTRANPFLGLIAQLRNIRVPKPRGTRSESPTARLWMKGLLLCIWLSKVFLAISKVIGRSIAVQRRMVLGDTMNLTEPSDLCVGTSGRDSWS
jgi:hypothetical protein